MSTSQDAFHSFADSYTASPKRRSSPDHGFVFVGDEHDRHSASQPKEFPEAPSAGLSRSSSQARAASPGFGSEAGGADGVRATPAWMDRAMEQTRMLLELDHTPTASDMLAAPGGSSAALVGENAQLRARLMEVSAQHQWALDAVVKGKDADAAELARALRDMTDQRDALEQELRHNEKEFVRLVTDAMDEKLAESFERFTAARSTAPPGLGGASEVKPMEFSRVAAALRRKSEEFGMVPRTSMALDGDGRPAYVALDWVHPEHVAEAAPVPPPAAVQRPKRRGVGWPKPRPGAAATQARAVVSLAAHQASRGARALGGIPRKTAQGPLGQTAGHAVAAVGHAVLQVPPAVSSASRSIMRSGSGASRSVTGACRAAGQFTGEQLAKVGHQSMRFTRWVRQPDVIERLETYLGLALVLLLGYASFRKLRAQPPGKRSRRCMGRLGSCSAKPEPVILEASTGQEWQEDGEAGKGRRTAIGDASSKDKTEAPLWAPFALAVPTLPPLPSLPEITIDEVEDGDVVIHIDGHPITLPRFMGGSGSSPPHSEG